MKRVVASERVPIKMWLEDIEEGALEQAKNLANLPFAFKHIAIMPDSHQGYGMPIGGVLATRNAIIPNAVGVDIGCGMCSIKTNLTEIDKPSLKKIMGIVRETVPVGFNHHKEKQDEKWMPVLPTFEDSHVIVEAQYEKARTQVGTLGGGNHFIEIQKGSDDHIWIMIHSGSRNIGFTVAKHYNELAQKLNERWYSEVPKDLAFFPANSAEYQAYFDEMNYCVDFALANRKLMMERVLEAFETVMNKVETQLFINKPHNFASWENHYNSNVIVHRKGATRAREGELGMIPGSQGTHSYIVRGKGEPLSFESCSHGAGRKMSRTEARNTLDLAAEKALLEDKGVIHAIRSERDLDEAPSSYKDIATVMENQLDLIDVDVELSPLAVIKG